MTPHQLVPFSLGRGPALDALLGLGTLQQMYESLPPGDFVERALERLAVQVSALDAAHVPDCGPAIVVANHPTGALDGLALLSALRARRRDVRVLGNLLLTRIPEMREWTFPVDPYRAASRLTMAGVRAARRWVEGGGVLAVFPAGAVARRCREQAAEDEPWHEGVLSLARWTGAPVVPAHLSGRPGPWFRLLGRLHPAIGTALLPRELLRQQGSRVVVRFGAPVSEARLSEWPEPSRLAYLRTRVHALDGVRPAVRPLAPLAPTVIPSLIRREVEALPEDARLGESRSLSVYCVAADQIPHGLREIGRLRERTFREVGEGTGRRIDLDRHDRDYRHLFLWDASRGEIAGAYRMGAADGPRHEALYTESLFDWRRRPGALLGPSLELGRSFVRVEHQRDPASLLMLWKGIGAFVARHPHYRRLFGPVSISAEYSPASRDLIAAWLVRHAAADAAAEVRGRHTVCPHPDARALVESGGLSSVAALDATIRELEGGRGMPVLLRQYLRLNGRVLALSRDPDFGDVIDALLVVDMLAMPPTHLERYCGAAGAHRVREAAHRPDPRRNEAAAVA